MPFSRSEIRKSAGLNQMQLASACGMTASKICNWEKGLCELPANAVRLIAETLFTRLNSAPRFDEVEDLINALETGHCNKSG
jgi:transcriptional regulator with XRE-family HTH domain